MIFPKSFANPRISIYYGNTCITSVYPCEKVVNYSYVDVVW